ncbi:MAG: SDR family NAD(P)-dependent oxidoreductase [Melioribacteraceae bacterium]|nr:SDR family NAD(P)-dependent oxidoreductase [Melioribacteraceae bacterium]MCF8354580.1 SDR family NAD(P)-dependent oxidoreductase [Melioribacteraceae bacterium]MCF8394932.1 SDR family NAD(P)-dependent oxidoreductase [Melioribacteraceae bacterium]MCF8420157.1 SDR family NAD(P)-dependent oxidoreductase [Melioribacteraceae bacterium]
MRTGSVSVITGASRGIGRAIAINLAKQNHKLALFGRDKEALEKTASECINYTNDILIYFGEVSDVNFVNNSIQEVIEKFSYIDNLINNAGIAIFKKFTDSTLEDFKRQVDANVYGVYNFTRAAADVMISRRQGTIINISSLSGKNGFDLGTMYSATKHAVMGFTKSLMLELREYNIRVAAVCPGSVATEMLLDTPLEKSSDKILTPGSVAEVVSSIINLPQGATISEVEIRPTNPK